jgi:hypothetical protein
MTYDPDPLYVPEPDSDEAHYEAAAAYFDRLEYEKPEDRRGFLALVFMATLVVLAIIAAALLIGGGR